MGVRNEVYTPELIKSAWKKTGIWPQDPGKFTDKDFAPSKLMSYSASLPLEYPQPTDVPDMLETYRSKSSGPTTQDEVDEVGENCRMDDYNGDSNRGSNGGGNDESGGGSGNESGGSSHNDNGGESSSGCGDEHSTTDDGMTGETDVGMDDRTVDEGGTDVGGMGGLSTMNEVSGDAITRESDVVSSPLRYEEESYYLEQPILTTPQFCLPCRPSYDCR
jgi:hypothetical protein